MSNKNKLMETTYIPIIIYDGTNHKYIILYDIEPYQEIIDFKKNKPNNNQLKNIISYHTRRPQISPINLTDKLYKDLKKKIDEIIILTYNDSHSHTDNKNVKNYKPESFTDYLEKESRDIKVKADTLNETYNSLRENLRKEGNVARGVVSGGILLASYNAVKNPTIQSIGLPLVIACGSLISYTKNRDFVNDLKESYDTKKDKHDTIDNLIDRIKNKDLKLTIIKPNQ